MGRKAKRPRALRAQSSSAWDLAASASEGPDNSPEDLPEALEPGDDISALSQEECGKELAEFLMFLKGSGTLSAKQASLLAYWSDRAGACGVGHLAYPPNRQTGKYSQHWDAALQTQPTHDLFYMVSAPVWRRADGTIDSASIPCIPPHVAVVLVGCVSQLFGCVSHYR